MPFMKARGMMSISESLDWWSVKKLVPLELHRDVVTYSDSSRRDAPGHKNRYPGCRSFDL